MTTLNKRLDQYAELIVAKGVNVQPDQTIILYAAVDQAAFARKIVAAAYARGARRVIVEWSDQTITKLDINNMAADLLTTTPQYTVDRWEDLIVNQHASRISLISDDPDGLADIDSQRYAQKIKTSQRDLAMVREATMRDDISWLVVAAAAPAWAKKVFPDVDEAAAVDQLWDAILTDVRVDGASDPVANWDAHITQLRTKADWLNAQNFKELRYTTGTSRFTIGLADGHVWEAALSKDKAGNAFIANMPTEEVFTSPDSRNLSGHVESTMPLSYRGTLIENIAIDFENGRIVKATASKGQATLDELIATDDGAKSLGEVSLVPYHSPISESGILFYNTLFDENASNHLAIGAAYASNIQGGKTDSKADLAARGWNISDVHVDFMVGSPDTNIDGLTQDGQLVPVFRDGDWA